MLSIIVAVSENGVIGKNNELLWRLSDDLKFFKAQTTGHAIIMGRKTFESIGKPLPNRLNIVISRNVELKFEGCEMATSIAEAVKIAENKLPESSEIFIIGGEQIYKLAQPHCDKLYVTQVKKHFEGDAFFDVTPYLKWKKVTLHQFQKNDKNECDFDIVAFEK